VATGFEASSDGKVFIDHVCIMHMRSEVAKMKTCPIETCPNCGSTRVGTIKRIVDDRGGFKLIFRCEDCGYERDDTEAVSRLLEEHGEDLLLVQDP